MTLFMKSKKLLFLAAAIGAAASLGDVQATQEKPAGSLRYWVVDDSTKILPGREMGAAGGEVELAGAGSETVAFQLVLESPTGLDRVRLKVSDLVPTRGTNGGPSSAANRFRVFLETYIDCPEVDGEAVTLGPGRYPDPLVPLWIDGPGTGEVAHPLEIPANQRRVLWVDLSIPRDQRPGR
jgi:hypothetical protein